MGVTVGWYDDTQTVVRYVFEGTWNWAQFHACWEWVKAALDGSAHKVSVMIDLSATRHIPPDSLTQGRALLQQTHPNFSGLMVVVGAGKLALIYGAMAQQMSGQYQILFADTLEEARHLLDDWDSQQNERQ